MSTQVGDIIDGLGVISEGISDTDLVSDAVVLLKILEEDGSVRLTTLYSPGMSWIERLGMLTAALEVERPSVADMRDEGDGD